MGISLAGHKDRMQMAVVVAGMNPKGNAYRDEKMQVGDVIMEVNGKVLFNRYINIDIIYYLKSYSSRMILFLYYSFWIRCTFW